MGSDPPKPQVPQKTLKQQITEYTKQLAKMRRDFAHDCSRLEMKDKKMIKDLKKLMENKQPTFNKKMLAQNILKNQKAIIKYKNLDAQLQNTTFELQSMLTMDQMQNVMNGMANIMGSAKGKIKIEQFQKSMKTYTTEKEKMQALNEMITDTMELEDEEIDDNDVDTLIHNVENQMAAKRQRQAEENLEEQPM